MIATPHVTHAPIALAASAAERVLLVGHVTRLLPLVEVVLERLDRGEIGQPRAAWRVRHQPLRRVGWIAERQQFGMLLHSPAVHNVDLMNRILGRPVRVTALATGSLDIHSANGPEQVRMPTTGWGLDAAIDDESRSFAAAIRDGSTPFVDPTDALFAVAVCEAADRSIATGQSIDIATLMTRGPA